MEENNIVEQVRRFVEEECKKPTSKYGYGPYIFHFVPVHDYAKKLAEELGADIEVVEIASWLHDIGSIIHGRENHHVTGSEIAEKKLREFGYSEDKITKVKKCIFNHRGSTSFQRLSLEEQVIADADAMSAFDDITGVFIAALVYESKSRDEARYSVRQKMINSYNKLSPKAKQIVRNKYEAVMLLLGEPKKTMQIVNLCIFNEEKNKILLINRKKEPYRGYWGMPGGKIKEGESPSFAGARELFEETEITHLPAEAIGKCSEKIVENNSTLYEFDIHFIKFVTGSMGKSADNEGELRWFKLAELENEKIIPSDLPMIKNFCFNNKKLATSLMKKEGENYILDKFEAIS